jgi:hypothetical protein
MGLSVISRMSVTLPRLVEDSAHSAQQGACGIIGLRFRGLVWVVVDSLEAAGNPAKGVVK